MKNVVPVSCKAGSPQDATVLFISDGSAWPGASVYPVGRADVDAPPRGEEVGSVFCPRVGLGLSCGLDDSDGESVVDSVDVVLDGEDVDVELVDMLLLDGVGALSDPQAAANGIAAQAAMMRARLAVWAAIAWFLSWGYLCLSLFCVKVNDF